MAPDRETATSHRSGRPPVSPWELSPGHAGRPGRRSRATDDRPHEPPARAGLDAAPDRRPIARDAPRGTDWPYEDGTSRVIEVVVPIALDDRDAHVRVIADPLGLPPGPDLIFVTKAHHLRAAAAAVARLPVDPAVAVRRAASGGRGLDARPVWDPACPPRWPACRPVPRQAGTGRCSSSAANRANWSGAMWTLWPSVGNAPDVTSSRYRVSASRAWSNSLT